MEIQIRKYRFGEESFVHQLVKSVYDEFIAPEYTKEGNRLFYAWIAPLAIASRQQKENNLWLAVVGNALVGILEIRDSHHICLLFVHKEFHHKGIAKKLFEAALIELHHRVDSLKAITVNASPYAVAIYKKMGFTATDSMCQQQGILYLPMQKLL